MKLDMVKENSKECYRIGFDKYSDNYLLEIQDTLGNNKYFIITEMEYKLFEEVPDQFEKIVKKCKEENSRCSKFYFSDWERENINEQQNRLMWKYTYISMFLGKKRDEIHKKIGEPNEILENHTEIFEMSLKLKIKLTFDGEVCNNVDVLWKEIH